MLVFLFNKHHASGEFSKCTFIQKTKDLRMGKGHKENGSSRCCTHGKKAKPKLDHLEFCLCCCLLCLAVESSSCCGGGCGDVAYGVWLSGEASHGCLLHLNEPGAVCQDEWWCRSLHLLLLCFLLFLLNMWWQTWGSWSRIFGRSVGLDSSVCLKPS